MTTLSKYEPSLTYEPSFDTASSLESKKLVMTLGDEDEKEKEYMSGKIRVCSSTTTEEVLYTYRIFKDFIQDVQSALKKGKELRKGQELSAFKQVLGPEARASFKDMVRNINSKDGKKGAALVSDPFDGDFDKAFKAFILHVVEDPEAKESVIAAFGDGKTFLKPADVSVRAHQQRITELCNYVDLLPGDRKDLTDDEKRNIFFNTFPKSWKDAFRKSAHDVTTSSIQTIKEWMTIKKDEMDKDYNKKKKEKESKKGDKKPMKKGKQNSSDICKIHGEQKLQF